MSAAEEFSASDPRVLEPGTVVAERYVVLETLGKGGMGIVYAAYDPKLARKVALKVLRDADSSRADEQRARLLREARVMARLSHPNVPAVYDVGNSGGRDFIAMELVSGRTLQEWASERTRTWREAVRVFSEAGEGLAAAHEAELIHRDFKPDNVLIDEVGRVRVTDFGLARLMSMDGGEEITLTRSGAPLGTPDYMAPELLSGKPADARTDQFAYCVSLYEVLYGARPRPDAMDAPTRGNRYVPSWLLRLLRKGLQADPSRRFASMNALLAAMSDGLRRQVGGPVGIARLAGILAWLMVDWLIYARGDTYVLSQLVGLHVYAGVALLLVVGQRASLRFRSLSQFAVPLLDVPFIFLERHLYLGAQLAIGQPDAAWYNVALTVAIYMVILSFSIVTLDPVVVLLTTLLAVPMACALSLQVRPHDWVGVLSHAIPLTFVGVMGFYATRRIQAMLRTIAPRAARKPLTGMLEDPWSVTMDFPPPSVRTPRR